jgi:hypothetical protein
MLNHGANHPPICGITKTPLRAHENHQRIRLAAEDITPEALAKLRLTELKPGLYQAGPEAFETFAPIVLKRTGGHLE